MKDLYSVGLPRRTFRNWCREAEVTKYLTWPPHKNVSVTEQVISDWISKYRDKSFYQWAIEVKEIGEPIGSISVVKTDDDIDMVHIGCCIGTKWWHKGYTSEAFSAIIPFLFSEVKAQRIESLHAAENPNSGRVSSADSSMRALCAKPTNATKA